MKKLTTGIIATMILSLGAMFTVAQTTDTPAPADKKFGKRFDGKRGGHKGKRGMRGMSELRGVELTEDQKAQVKQIHQASREKMKSTHEALRANHQKMRDLEKTGVFDEGLITLLANEQAQLSAKMMVERARTKHQIQQLLTPDQKAKIAERQAKMKEMRAKRMEGRKMKRGEKAPAETTEN